MHIFNVSITTVQSLENVSLKVWEEFITQSRYPLFTNCWKIDKVQLHVNFSKKARTLPKSHMHIFNVSITTVQSLENISLKMWESCTVWIKLNSIYMLSSYIYVHVFYSVLYVRWQSLHCQYNDENWNTNIMAES
jgi:hypothetical protein